VTIQIKISSRDAETIRRALSNPQLLGGPIRSFLVKTGFVVERTGKENAPVDTGRLRSSITSRVGQDIRSDPSVFIGSNLLYAPYVEFGTKPHWPPLSAMQPWAKRHGFPAGRRGAFLVARAISRRGTRPQPFLVPALKSNAARIRSLLVDAAREVERRFKSG
jgi:HK97 gp10 family phage protein